MAVSMRVINTGCAKDALAAAIELPFVCHFIGCYPYPHPASFVVGQPGSPGSGNSVLLAVTIEGVYFSGSACWPVHYVTSWVLFDQFRR